MKYFKTFMLYSMLCAATFMMSSIFYFVDKECIIVRWPSYDTKPLNNETHAETKKKNVRLFFWHHNRWNHEMVDILWSGNTTETIQHIIRSLLTLLEEEQILEKKVSLQSVAQSLSGNNIYLSFDRTPFNEEASTLDKLMIIESILKTVRENNITIPNIYFLVHHQPMQDLHLDFSHAWPLEGFLNVHNQHK